MQHRRVRGIGQKLGGPQIELLGPDRYGERLHLAQLESAEIVVDAPDRLLGCLVPQHWVLRATVEGPAIQRDEGRLFLLRQVNFFGFHRLLPFVSSSSGALAHRPTLPVYHPLREGVPDHLKVTVAPAGSIYSKDCAPFQRTLNVRLLDPPLWATTTLEPSGFLKATSARLPSVFAAI